MKFTLGLLILGFAVILANARRHDNEKLVTRESIEELKSKASFEVLDYEEHPFKDLTREQVINKLGLMKSLDIVDMEIVYGDSSALPASFNYREKWPQCFHQVRDQQSCGSCWAFAASEVLSDRFCIASNGSTNVVLSPQDLVSCDRVDQGCNGGYVDKSWDYIKNTGIVADECLPYTSGKGSSGSCPFNSSSQKCKVGTFKKYKVKSHRRYTSISDAKTSISTEGPIEAAFSVYQDFMSYKGGVYRKTSSRLLGGHAVKIVGWGKDTDGTEYWVVANSWGVTWGEQGFFRIAFGQCGFENQLWAGVPLV